MKNYQLRPTTLILVFVGSLGMLALLRWVVAPMLGLNSTTEPSIISFGLGLLAFAMIVTAVGSILALIASLLPKSTK